MPSPGHSGYSRVNGDNSLTIEYVKDIASGTVRSVHFGRGHTSTTAIVGQLVGEPRAVTNWTSGGTPFFLDHRIGASEVVKNTSSTAYRMGCIKVQLRDWVR